MQKYINSVADKSGKPISGATVVVSTYPGGVPATIYSDNGLTPIPLLLTDKNGMFSFYAADDHYTITITSPNGVSVILSDIQLEDLRDGIDNLVGATGSSRIGFIQSGSGATARTLQSKVREQPISITDFSALVFTATAKDAGDPASHVGLTFTSWKLAIQAAIDEASARGGGTVLVPGASAVYYVDDYFTLKSNVRMEFEGEIVLADYTTIGATAVVQGDNIEIINPRINNSSIYAGGSGQNGIGILSGNGIKIIGGKIKNCARGQDFITPGSPNDGGKAIQIEDGGGENITVTGVTLSGCFIAMSTIRDGSNANPYHGIVYSDINADNCDILFFVKQTNISSTTGLEHTVQLNNFYAVNCGAFEGVMQFSRASNVLVSNGIVANDPSIAATSLIRGNIRNSRFSNVLFSADATSIVNLDSGTYCQDASHTPENNHYDIAHSGTVGFLINGAAAVVVNCTGAFQLQNDLTSGFFGFAQRNGNSSFLVSQGGKSAMVGTNLNYHPFAPVYKFSQLPVNYSSPNGVKFPSVRAPSAETNTFDYYGESQWTPTDASGAGLALTAYGDCTIKGREVTATFSITFPVTADAGNSLIGGLPYPQVAGARVMAGLSLRYTDQGAFLTAAGNPGSSTFTFFTAAGVALTNVQMSGKTVHGAYTYFTET